MKFGRKNIFYEEIFLAFNKAKIDKVKNITIPIISINDLIEMKKNLARAQDLIDVENLKKIKKERGY